MLDLDFSTTKISFHNLKDKPEWLEQVAMWIENEWGYLRGNLGLESRKERLKNTFVGEHDLPRFMIAAYQNKPIGTFALMDYEFCPEIAEKSKNRKIFKAPLKFNCVYVDKP